MSTRSKITVLSIAALAGSAAAADLQVTVRNLLPRQGELMLALFDRAQGFPGEPAASSPAQRLRPEGDTATLVFKGLPEGRWAVIALQDLNGNGRLDTNLLGIPKEPYGASNNRLPRLSPPRFDEALVELGPQGAAITIELRQP
jgi:uncharacterized protein (DUF2141 family)